VLDWAKGWEMNDRELLELAAKAEGTSLYCTKDGKKFFRRDGGLPICAEAAEALRTQAARIAELEREVEALRKVGEVVVTKDEFGVIVAVTRQDEDHRILSVVAQSTGVGELRKDAERYQWLRRKDCPWAGVYESSGYEDFGWYALCEGALDDAIDASMKEKADE